MVRAGEISNVFFVIGGQLCASPVVSGDAGLFLRTIQNFIHLNEYARGSTMKQLAYGLMRVVTIRG